jgi:hypothetical protein
MQSSHKKLSSEKCKDAGLALTLICLLCYQVWKLEILILGAVVFLIVAMTYPPIFKPFARLWFTLSTAIGTVVSKIILTILFFLLVLPIGMIRRVLGKDSMRIKGWKKGNESVFCIRKHRFSGKDLVHPY